MPHNNSTVSSTHTPSTVLRNQLHIPTLKQRRTYLFLCEFYKLYNNVSNSHRSIHDTHNRTPSSSKQNQFIRSLYEQGSRPTCATQGPEHSTLCQNIYKTAIYSQFKKKTTKAPPPRLTIILCVLVIMQLFNY